MKTLFSLRHHEKPVSSIRFHPQDPHLLASCDANFVYIFDLRSRRPSTQINLTKLSERANFFALQWVGNDILVQDRLGFVTRLDHEKSFEPETVLSTRCSTFFKNKIIENKFLLTGGEEQDQICVWNLEDRACNLEMRLSMPDASRGMLMGAQAIDSNLLAIASEGGFVDFLEVSGDRAGAFHLPGQTFTGIMMNQSGNAGVCTTASNQFHSFTADHDERKYDLYRSVDLDCQGASTPVMRDDNKIFGLIGWDRCVRLYQWKKLKLIQKIPSKFVINDLHFQPGTKRFAFASENGSITIHEFAR